MYDNIKSLYHTPETIIIFWFKCTSVKNREKKRLKRNEKLNFHCKMKYQQRK